MTTETNGTTAANEANEASIAAAAAAHREASQYWGYLIKQDKCGTPTLDRLLNGLAEVISKQFYPTDSPDITPSQLAAFYRAVGGDYDVLFLQTPPSSLSFIYRSLGAFHSLQPAPDDDGYSTPAIPALKHKGFVTWQTVQLLLGPEEHVPFLQKAVALFDVVDSNTGIIFPKILPKECFPDRPDDAMETWYEGVAQRLKNEAEDDVDKADTSRVRVEVDDPRLRTSGEISGDGSADERHGAARYFDDPLYRKGRVRPTVVHHFSKQPRAYVEERGRVVASSVRHMLNPFRRKSLPGRHGDDYSDEDATPIATAHLPPRYSHKRPHAPRREGSLPTTDSESDSDGPSPRHRVPVLRHRRSHDSPTSPQDYFPRYHEERRYSHDMPPDPHKGDAPPVPVYGPTKSPLFATQVAHIQAHNYYDRRPALPQRTSYRSPGSVRYMAKPASPAELPYMREHPEPAYAREREREHGRSRDNSRSHHRRRRSEEYPSREKDARERSRSGRTARSHDRNRVKDEWDERDRSDKSRERSRSERERERERAKTHRYVSAVEGGVSGRRYPVEQPWR